MCILFTDFIHHIGTSEHTMTTAAKFKGTIQPWGNSLGLRITKTVGHLARLAKGTKVVVEVTKDGLMVRPRKGRPHLALPFTERDLIAGLTPHKAHADELPKPLASEIDG